jgi:hypothetical protein
MRKEFKSAKLIKKENQLTTIEVLVPKFMSKIRGGNDEYKDGEDGVLRKRPGSK